MAKALCVSDVGTNGGLARGWKSKNVQFIDTRTTSRSYSAALIEKLTMAEARRRLNRFGERCALWKNA